MKKLFFKTWTFILKQPFFAWLIDKLTASKISGKLIPWYIKHYGVQDSTIELPIKEYSSIQAFFTRKLSEEKTNFNLPTDMYASPVQGLVKDFGKITAEKEFFIKNKNYSLEELVGLKNIDISNSHFIILYLSPKNYHRFHAPINGQYSFLRNLGKLSYPVNQQSVDYIEGLFTKNYRAVYQMNDDYYVPVGALNINSIKETFTSGETLSAGDELGYFNFGSTVILFFMNKDIQWDEGIVKEQGIELGQPLARIIK